MAPALLFAGRSRAYTLEEIEERLRAEGPIEGVTKHDLPTPALLLDLDRLEANVSRMARHAQDAGVALRPHAKTHKCPEIARRQVAAGALGVCAATIWEAEVLARAGLPGILITSELTGPNKIHRLLRLAAAHPDTMSVVDNPEHAEQLSEAAEPAGLELNVLVDVDPVGRRTGVEAGEPAVELAKRIDSLAGLRLRGVHGYSGASSHVVGFEERRAHSRKYMQGPVGSFLAMQKAGLPAEILSGASTGTYNIDSELDAMTELQVGSYVFMDVDYRRIGGESGEVYDDFQPSLTVLGTVISKNHKDLATLDAGIKAVASDRDFGPEVLGIDGAAYRFGGDEHGILELESPSRELKLGEKLELLVPHCDPNVNLYDRLYCVRGDNVVDVWKVSARGHI